MALNNSNLGLTNKKIVIVEDDIYSIRYYETLLKSTGASLKILRTGLEFVEYIKKGDENIDFIFMDYLIPLVNGIDCIRIYRKSNRNTPIVMLTAYSSEQTKTEAYIAGCNEYVLKPVYCEKLLFLLDRYLIRESTVAISY
jgi:CheY-like chemotaxis protein